MLPRGMLVALIAFALLAAAACGGAAPATQTPSTSPSSTSPATAVATEVAPTPTPITLPTVTPAINDVASARDSITLVIGQEPLTMNPYLTQGGIATSVVKDNMVDPLTWQSADDLRIVPTTASESWEQLAPDHWRFNLRQGVRFHNGEIWNAEAAMPSLEFQGTDGNANSSAAYTGTFRAEVVDEYALEIMCDQPCPIFPQTSVFLNFQAPDFYTNASEEESSRGLEGFGPYRLAEWQPGISVTQEAYEDYVPAGDHFEFQLPLVRETRWFWRGETTVMTAMVEAGEADIAWDVGVESIETMGREQVRSGGSAEVYGFWINTLWHPELKKKEVRRAMVHSVNCQEIVDVLYGGFPPCRGNIIFPGVTGATEQNIAPYEYDRNLAAQLLEDANYDPGNVIRITSRSSRIPKQVELAEAIHGYMTEAGISAEINIVEPSVRQGMRLCGVGSAVNKVLEDRGDDPETVEPSLEDMQAALDAGPACPTGDLISVGGISSETLDFGRQVVNYMNCTRPVSFYCDPSPGGVQTLMGPALAASGEEREQLMADLATRAHEDVIFFPLFDLPVFYAVDPDLNWNPRFDRRVRISTMWFSE